MVVKVLRVLGGAGGGGGWPEKRLEIPVKSGRNSCAAGEGKQRRLVGERVLSENLRSLLALLRQYMSWALYTLQGFNWLKNQVIW